MIEVEVSLFYHLKQKAGTSTIKLSLPAGSEVRDLKDLLEEKYPSLTTHLDNVLILNDKKIILEEDILNEDANISFLTPIGGG